jgi:phospholipid/cholesterol/gamma-HCH transport system substrate-binding protein
MKDRTIELIVGLFVVVGLLAIAYLTISLGEVELLRSGGYIVHAEFGNTSGLKEGATVEIAGVEIGKVEGIRLEEFNSYVTMRITAGMELPDDTIASIRTHGMIGEKYVQLSPGGSSERLDEGDTIIDTESSINIEELIGKYIYSQE